MFAVNLDMLGVSQNWKNFVETSVWPHIFEIWKNIEFKNLCHLHFNQPSLCSKLLVWSHKVTNLAVVLETLQLIFEAGASYPILCYSNVIRTQLGCDKGQLEIPMGENLLVSWPSMLKKSLALKWLYIFSMISFHRL